MSPALRTRQVIRALWRLSRPPIWMVSILPLYMGSLLATHELFPGLKGLASFVSRALNQGATASEMRHAIAASIRDARPLLVAALVMGPVIWAAALCINDVHDAAADRLNPRRAASPLVVGLISERSARRAAYLFAAAALAGAATLGRPFFVLVAVFLCLAWAYSVPPVRLKERPGLDLAVNAVGIGVIAPLAGWSVWRPLTGFPWIMLIQGTLVAGAVYVPSTLVDLTADRESGTKTIATTLGRDRAYAIGWRAWLASCAGVVALALANVVVPRRMLFVLALSVPLLIWEYHSLIGHAPDERAIARGIVICSFTFAASNLCFALMYTGVWS